MKTQQDYIQQSLQKLILLLQSHHQPGTYRVPEGRYTLASEDNVKLM
jgi:hypothetical protein